MPYYLKWPADTGSEATNNSLVQISGISGILQTVKYTLAEDMLPQIGGRVRYLYDRRRAVDTAADDGSTGWLFQGSGVQTANTSNWRINGASVPIESLFSALANDECSFDVGQDPVWGCIAFGARFSETESNYSLAVKNITIIDDAGTHTIDMSSSNGTASELTSTDGAVTLKLFNFSVPACWVFYSGGAYTLTADGATFSYSGGIASTIYSRILSADGGLFSYSGGVAETLLNRRIASDGATFGYSGGASALLYGRALQSDGGSFSYSGGVATFVYNPITGYVLNADGGIFSYAGGEAALSFNQNYPTANPNDYTVSAYLSTDSTYTARLSESSTINAIISASSTINARLN